MKDKRKDKGGKVRNAASSAPRDSKPTGGSGAGREDDMINIAVLREVVELMRSNDLTEVSIVRGSDELSIRRGSQMVVTQAQPAPVYSTQPAPAPAPAAAPASQPAAAAPATGAAIESPMVGTFYSRPNPDAKPFVTAGQTVNKDTVVCIIEAMKVFNEIKAEKDGVVESMLVKDGQAVEFGQRLFALK